MTAPRKFLRFGVVGAIGFMVDGGLLWLLVSIDGNPFLARSLSFPAAVVTTCWLNRIWTFANATKSSPRRQLNLYFALQLVGALTNFCCLRGHPHVHRADAPECARRTGSGRSCRHDREFHRLTAVRVQNSHANKPQVVS